MKDELAKIKSALATKEVIAHLTHYYFSQGEIIAANGRMTAGVPFQHDMECLVPADRLDAFIANAPPEFKFKLINGDELSLTAPKLRARIKVLGAGEYQVARPEGDGYTPPENLLAAIKVLAPFVSKNATHPWSTGVFLKGDQAYATNNTVMARCEPTGYQGPNIIVPGWACDYLMERSEAPTEMYVTENSLSFIWSDASWMRTQLLAGEWPEICDSMIDGIDPPEAEIDPDLRAALKIASVFDGERIELQAGKIIAGSASSTLAEVDANITHGIGSIWNPQLLAPVLEIATKWNPDLYPNPVPWDGGSPDGGLIVEGIVMGRER